VTRINTNVDALRARQSSLRARTDLQNSLQRLSSGLQINRGADDPAGLIASERLRSEIAGIGQGINNSVRASNVIATAEGALNEISALLTDVHQLILECANTGALSEDEIAADQLQIDSAIASINRIANVTQFGGRKLLDGSLDYILSGVDHDVLTNLHVYRATCSATSPLPVNIEGIPGNSTLHFLYWTSGHPATLTFPQPCSGFAALDSRLRVRGPLGSRLLAFPAGTGTTSNILSAVNAVFGGTGVTASLGGDGNDIVFSCNGYLSIEQIPAYLTHQLYDHNGSVNAQDLSNITPARLQVNGVEYPLDDQNQAVIRTPYLSMDVGLTDNILSTGATTTFYVAGGGSLYQTGPAVDGQSQVSMAIPSVVPSALGDSRVGFLNQIISSGDYSLVGGHEAEADIIVQEAIRQIAVLRGQLGAFEKNILQTSIDANQITLENVTASESRIRDADFAKETAQLARAQVLENSGTSVLDIANHRSQAVLDLLKTNT